MSSPNVGRSSPMFQTNVGLVDPPNKTRSVIYAREIQAAGQ